MLFLLYFHKAFYCSDVLYDEGTSRNSNIGYYSTTRHQVRIGKYKCNLCYCLDVDQLFVEMFVLSIFISHLHFLPSQSTNMLFCFSAS